METTITDQQVQDFWSWFLQHREAFYFHESDRENLFDKLQEQLHRVQENLTFEFSPVHADGVRELIISADGIREAFPAVKKLVAAAPAITNWRINAFRQRVPGDHLAIAIGNIKLGYDDIYFRHYDNADTVGLQLHIRGYDSGNNTFKSAVFILLDALIGEYDMETKIGGMEWEPLDGSRLDELLPIVELRTVVDEMPAR